MDKTTFSALLSGIEATIDPGTDPTVSGVAYRSDRVAEGDAFFCIPGFRHDGHDFAADAAARGAAALVVERRVDVDLPQAVVGDARRALAIASSVAYGRPTEHMDVVGVTGTNGKTTTTYLIDSILCAAGRVTGIVGTVETRVAGERMPSARTTPESADLQALFAEMLDRGVDGASIEVSSHAIDLHRVDGVRFAVAAFTNLTQDHLDYHHTLEEYFAVKRRLFTELDVAAKIVNIDDEYGRMLAREVDVTLTVGCAAEADVRAEDVALDARSSTFTLYTPQSSMVIELPIAGAYNVSNALVAAGCAIALGIELETIAEGLRRAPQVPGRLERIDEGQTFSVLVDYAHTPDSLEKAIGAVRAVTPGRVITVFGCGGDRDPEKRPVMGRVAGDGSDLVVVTSDNPRSEDPVGIILHIEDGLRLTGAPYLVEVDRRRAIALALAEAREGDAVLIAGKGHEDYQVFLDRTIHFDDREVAREELRTLC